MPKSMERKAKSRPKAWPVGGQRKRSGFPIVGMGASAGGLEALQEFFKAMSAGSGMAHDFNNLLHAVLGHAEIVRERLPVSSPLRRSVMAIEEASKRAAELAAKMLAYSGKGKFVLEEVDLSAMSVEVGRLLENSIGRRTAVTYQLAHDLPKIVVDAVQIRQVIMNLFLNAAEAIGVAIGTIRVSTAVRDCDQAFFESAQAAVDLTAGPYVCLTVADTGCGMDETVREKLFEPFFTTKFSGRGLGMAASLGIVRSHSGAIRVDSEPGRGTSIQVLLPAAPDPAGEPAAGSAAPAPAKRGSETVLVVEGDAEVGSVIECLLRELGFDVLTVADGDRAVEVMRSHTADVRLVLLDSKIRDMRPQEALTAMRLVARDIQVVVMTGGGEEEAERQFTGHGVCGFLLKPFGKAGLDRTIRLALR